VFAKLKHAAIVSDQYTLSGKFYEAVFKLKSPDSARPDRAVNVGDGYVGLNINPRKPGRQAGFDHFGFEVEDVETVFSRLKADYPKIEVLKRPGNRPFAGLSTHDPAGNVFDLSQKGMENRAGIYEESEWQQGRHIHHLALRAVVPEALAEFYVKVLELKALEPPSRDESYYLSDGRVTLMILPWKITHYSGSGIERPALDHFGFHVESLEGFKEEVDKMSEANPALSPRRVGVGPEGKARLELLAQCPYGKFHLSDPDGSLIDVHDG